MTEKEFDLDEVELHSDVSVHRSSPPDQDPEPQSGKKSILPWILCLLLAAGAGWLGYERHRLLEELNSVQSSKAETDQSLNQTKENLDQIQADATAKDEQIKTIRNMLEATKEQVKKLEGQLSAAKKEQTKAEKTISKHQNEIALLEKSNSKLEKEKASLSKSVLQAQEQAIKVKQEAETAAEDASRQYQELFAKHNANEHKLKSQAVEIKELKDRMRKESDASLEIIRERGKLVEENKKLKLDQNQIQRENDQLKTKIKELEEVQLGELVPYSMDLIPGEITYREPLDKAGLPRKFGPYAVQVLVTETGAVQNAFILPDQEIESAVARAILENLKLWKFSPPTLNQTRVRTWQTVVVGSD